MKTNELEIISELNVFIIAIHKNDSFIHILSIINF